MTCPAGHAFDVAASGYLSLLQPQDRRSRSPGDTRAALVARRRWIERGFAGPLADALAEELAGLGIGRGSRVLDVGCGEGSLGAGLAKRLGFELCGIDLSRDAARLAAQSASGATWLVANADRAIPVASDAVDLILSLFGRRHADEFRRVLRKDGRLLVAVPGAQDLRELREVIAGTATAQDRGARVVAEMDGRFALQRRRTVTWRARLDRQAIGDALAASYRGARRAERERAAALEALEVTLEAELLTFG